MTTKPTTVDEYVEALDQAARNRIAELRTLAHDTTPDLTETLKWGAPAFLHRDGVIMFAISAHKAHANITFTPSTREAFDAELTEWDTGKGSVKLPYDRDIPADTLASMIRHRITEFERDGVKWM